MATFEGRAYLTDAILNMFLRKKQTLCGHDRGKAVPVCAIAGALAVMARSGRAVARAAPLAGFGALAAAIRPDAALAHASEGSIVLLLPTGVWALAGTATVALTVLLVAVLPVTRALALFAPQGRPHRPSALAHIARSAAFVVLAAAIWHGLTGTGDPVKNAMPLLVWPVFWMGLVTLQALGLDLWRWLGPFAVVVPPRGLVRYPQALDRWPAVALFMAFTAFLLADPESTDPRRLAIFALIYLGLTALMGTVFGPRWLVGGEVFTVLMRAYARLAPLHRGRAGLWGWRAARGPLPGLAAAVFIAALLAGGSFDGLNETFLWLGLIGVNPLEFPGRSAIIGPTIAGLLALTAALLVLYAACLAAGLSLARHPEPLATAFRRFAPSLLPIAAVYHAAHYLVSFLVDAQWVANFASERLHLGHVHVSTGFLSSIASVRAIWLTQAGIVVAGHVVAVLLAHALALRAYGDSGRAWRVLAPLSLFMILYTLFGLWLLAAPRGA